jgi:hypothetical protein
MSSVEFSFWFKVSNIFHVFFLVSRSSRVDYLSFPAALVIQDSELLQKFNQLGSFALRIHTEDFYFLCFVCINYTFSKVIASLWICLVIYFIL